MIMMDSFRYSDITTVFLLLPEFLCHKLLLMWFNTHSLYVRFPESTFTVCPERLIRSIYGRLVDIGRKGLMDELWFYVPSTVFQSFRDDGRVNMKGSVQ